MVEHTIKMRKEVTALKHALEHLGLFFLKPVVNTPPGVLLGNLIGIPRKRIQI